VPTVKLERGTYVLADRAFLIDLDVESDSIVFWQNDKIVCAVLSEIDPGKIVRPWKNDMAWSPLVLNMVRVKQT